LGVKVPPVPENNVPDAVKLTILEPPSSVPLVLVQVPLKEWVNPVPRLNVPPVPFMVSPAPLILPVKVATPEVLVIDTRPVVVKLPIFCVAVVPERVTAEFPIFHEAPFPLIKSPWKVRPKLLVASVAPELMFKGALELLPICFAALRVIIPTFFITTPPAPVNGVTHSPPVVNAADRLYCRVPAGP